MEERTYGGIPISHDEEDVGLIQRAINTLEPELVIELGTQYGGLTLAIWDACRNMMTTEIHSFDCDPSRPYAELVELLRWDKRLHYVRVDILAREEPKVAKLCWDSLRKFLYCDNGNKVVEALTYGKYLRKGDMLGVHDWNTEIGFDYNRLTAEWQRINGKLRVAMFKDMIAKDFQLTGEGRQTRLWIKR